MELNILPEGTMYYVILQSGQLQWLLTGIL